MTNEQLKSKTTDLKARGEELIVKGNQRQLVFRNKAGKTFFETTLTIVAGVSAFLLLTGFVSVPLLVVAGAIAMFMGVRVELQHNESVSVVES